MIPVRQNTWWKDINICVRYFFPLTDIKVRIRLRVNVMIKIRVIVKVKARVCDIRYSLMESDLWDEVTLESHILAGPMRQCHGQDVGKSLGLVDDGVSEGQVPPVLQMHQATSNYLVDLLMHLI